MKVELDRRSLYALASDTRMEILKSLHANRRTVSQLAELLAIDKAAVHRHLKKLEEGGFVARTEDHGFVYYALTWKSRDILEPNDRTKIVILISSALICLLAMVVMAFMAVQPPDMMAESNDQASDALDGGPGDPSRGGTAPSSGLDIAALAVLGMCAAGLAGLAGRLWRRPRQVGGETDTDALGAADP